MMISHLRGTLIIKSPDEVVVSCGGVGYGLSMSVPSCNDLGGVGEEVAVWVHTHVSQDAIRLFGFLTEFERQAFRILIGASGVGPKMGLAVLSVFAVEELVRIVSDRDVAAMKQVPGIGAKKAEKILLDLSGKWPEVLAETVKSAEATSTASMEEEIVLALTQMGHKDKAAQDAAQAAIASLGESAELSALVWQALRETTPRRP